MPRTPRRFQLADEACFHVINRGQDRQAVFVDDLDRQAFLKLLDRYRERFSLRIFHYCLMTNHYHLLLQLPDPRRLSALMAGLQRAYGHHCHRRHGFVGHRWQGRFKSPAVQCREYLLSCGRYIERNPSEAGIVSLPWEYAWTSARAYALGEVDVLLAENGDYLELAPEAKKRQERWREFLRDEDPKEEVVRREEWVIGDEAFRRRLLIERGRPLPRRRGRPPKTPPAWCTISPQHISPE